MINSCDELGAESKNRHDIFCAGEKAITYHNESGADYLFLTRPLAYSSIFKNVLITIMLIIRKEQIRVLENDVMKRFIHDSLLFLEKNVPSWCHGKSKEEKEKFIREIIEFAHGVDILKEVNIQKLMIYKLLYNYTIPLSQYQKETLSKTGFDEEHRISQFYDLLTSKKELVKITLD